MKPTAPAPGTGWGQRPLSRAAFYTHLWLGVLFTTVLLVISVTGILLNHKRGLGLMPEVEHSPRAAFTEALPLARLAAIASDTTARVRGLPAGDIDPAIAIDRMDVRPRNGFVKVRMRDPESTEVTIDLASGAILHVGARGDVFLEKLHSGEIFGGQPWVLLSDAGAVALILTLLTGYWLWLAPKLRRSGPPAAPRERGPR